MTELLKRGWATFCQPFNPIDVIAVVLIVGCLSLVYFREDPIVSSILIMVVAYYFGKKTGVLPNN